MANPVGALFVDLGANSAAFVQDMGKARKALSSSSAHMNRNLARLDSAFGRVSSAVGRNLKRFLSFQGIIATVAGGAGLGLLVKRSVEAADNIAKTADRIGISTEALQEWRFAAEQSGVEIQQFQQALTALIRRAGEAQTGNTEFAKGFQTVGVSVRQLAQLTPEQLLMRVADGLAGIESQSLRVAAADRIMSEAGRQVINVFRGGSAGAQAFADQARRLGLVVRNDLLRNAERTQDQFNILSKVIRTNVMSAVLELTPQIGDLAQKFAEAIPKIIEATDRLGAWLGLWDRSDLSEAETRLKAINRAIDEQADLVASLQFARMPDAERAMGRLMALREERIELEKQIATLRERGEVESGFKADPIRPGGVEAPDLDAFERANQRHQARLEDTRAIIDRNFEAWRQSQQQAAQIFEETRTPLEQYQARVTDLNAMVAQGSLDWDTYGRAVATAQDALSQATGEAARTDQMAQQLGMTFTSAFEEAVMQGAKVRDVLRGIAQDIQRMIMRQFVTKPRMNMLGDFIGSGVSMFGGGSPAIASDFGFGFTPTANATAPGFAQGGRFTVPGSGGVDSSFVRFRATPGEEVEVRTPAQQRRGEGARVNITMHQDFRGAEAGVFARAGQFKQDIVESAVEAVFDAIEQGGTRAAAVGRRRRG